MRQRENMKRHKQQTEPVPANALLRKDSDRWEDVFERERQDLFGASNFIITLFLPSTVLFLYGFMAYVHLFDCTYRFVSLTIFVVTPLSRKLTYQG